MIHIWRLLAGALLVGSILAVLSLAFFLPVEVIKYGITGLLALIGCYLFGCAILPERD